MSRPAPLHPERQLARWVRFGVLFGVSLVGLWCFYVLRSVLLPLVVSLIIAYLLNPLVNALEARAVRRESAVALLTVGFLIVVPLIAWLFVPPLVDELARLRETLPAKLEVAQRTLVALEAELAARYPVLEGRHIAKSVFEIVREEAGAAAAGIPMWLIDHSASLVMIFLTPFFVFFILRDGEGWINRIYQALPHRSVETGLSVVNEFNNALGSYLRSLIIDALVVGGLVAAGLLAIGLDYAIVIGVISGIGNFVPYLGPILGASLAAVAALMQSGDGVGLLLQALIVFGIVKTLDDWIFQPLIIGHGAHVHPVLVVLAVTIGGMVLGIIGMVIAVPVTVMIQVALQIGFERYRFATEPQRRTALPPERAIV